MNLDKIIEGIWDRIEEIYQWRSDYGLTTNISLKQKYHYNIAIEHDYISIIETEDEFDYNVEQYANTIVSSVFKIKAKYFEYDGLDAYLEEVIKPEIKAVEERKARDEKWRNERDLEKYEHLKISLKEKGLID